MPDTTGLIARSLDESTVPVFEERVAEQADRLRTAIAAGEFDNADFAVGLEMEVYAVEGVPSDSEDGCERAGWRGRLEPLPGSVFDAGATKELGRHNAEINTDPDVCSGEGLASQAAAIEAAFESAREAARDEGLELVLDAMWTVPPESGSREFLSAHCLEDGVVLAENMRPDPRYRAIDNDVLRLVEGDIPFSVPGVDTTFPSILFESLATSIQPHLQIPDADSFPAYYNAGIRTLGPLLALATNSPFLPADLYGDVEDPEGLVAATHHELRIPVFEQSVNHSPDPKVRVPADIDDATEVVDRVVADDRYAPFLREWIDEGERDGLHDEVWEFDYKRSTYWRWLRCVVGGDPVAGAGDERSLRIEYRPLPTQPTVRDVVGLQALTVGLLRGLVAADHPLQELPWDAAVESFYAAAEAGLDADLAWVTADGERTSDPALVYDEVFTVARRGLLESGVESADVDRYLDPIETRVDAGTTPSVWKKERVREELTAGADLPGAIEAMQREYVRRSRGTDSFADWL
jgi:hypothetical protein